MGGRSKLERLSCDKNPFTDLLEADYIFFVPNLFFKNRFFTQAELPVPITLALKIAQPFPNDPSGFPSCFWEGNFFN